MGTRPLLQFRRLLSDRYSECRADWEVIVEAGPQRRYAKPYIVASSLDLLRGPTSGVVLLPRRLDWSGAASYDLEAPGRIVDLYRTVLIEATNVQDLNTYLDETILKRLWSYLWLPPALRAVWEERFLALAELSRLSAAG